MIVTEEDAGQKACPMGMPHRTAVIKCVGAACMAWRWVPMPFVPVEQHHGRRPPDDRDGWRADVGDDGTVADVALHEAQAIENGEFAAVDWTYDWVLTGPELPRMGYCGMAAAEKAP